MGVACLEAKSKYKKRYQLIRKIGEGGQARCIYLVSDNQQGKKLKVLKEMIIRPASLNKMIAQSKHLTQLNHTNIVKATDYFAQTIDDIMHFCIVMEYVDGGQLKQYLGKLTQPQIINIYEQLKSALQYIHQKGIIHRDITLRNILLDQMKNVKLIDFGISSELYGQTKLVTNPEIGTRYYFPPQLIKNFIVRIQTDLWQLGIIMIQLATRIEIKDLMKSENNQIVNPAFDEEFPDIILIKYKVSEKIVKLIIPLLQKDYKYRKFYEQVVTLQKQQPQTKKYPIKINKQTKINAVKLDNIELKIQQKIPKPQIIIHQIKKTNSQPQINKKQYQILHLNLKRMNTNQLLQNITIHHIQNLIELNFSNNQLTDDCAKIIRSLTNLERLDISGNNLTDIFCRDVNDMFSQFTRLNIAFTNITDDSLSIITKYGRNIQHLDISYTRVTSKSLITISQLKQLSSLAIWSGISYYPSRYYEHIVLNQGINYDKYTINNISITKDCIKQISQLRLKQLTINLKQNSVDEIINRMEQYSSRIEVKGKLSKQNIGKIVGMKELKRLYLYGIKDYVFKELKSKKLESIGLVKSNIVIKELVNNLSNCEELKDINLGQNNIEVQGATAIANRLTNLISLSLYNNKIEDEGATAIANRLTNLTTLDLGNNNIGVQGATAIANRLTNLTTLDLDNNNIGVQGATVIANRLINLTTLYLGWNKIGDQGAATIANSLNNLTSLYLHTNNIGHQGATAIADRLINLTTLSLYNNKIGGQGATAIANNLTNLVTLDLGWNKIGDQGATAIANRLINLTTLYLGWNTIGDQGAAAIANSLTNLISISLYSNNIGDKGATAIANSLINLTSISLYNNNIGDQGATAIANSLTNLTTLNLGVNNITVSTKTSICQRLKHIQLSI